MSVAVAPRLSPAERERRTALLHGILEEEHLDALVLAAADYRGHKGALRWVGDYNLVHRYGFALVLPGREPELVLPENLALGRRGGWDVPVRYVRRTGTGLATAVSEAGRVRRIGVAGLAEVMKVGDYLALRDAFPAAEIVDAGEAFERARAVKSDEELEGAREATRIAEVCFVQLLDLAAPGRTERDLCAELLRTAYSLGGEDFLFLSMWGEPRGDEFYAEFGPPGDRMLRPGDQVIFSFELIGPLGYWMELARMIVLGPPAELQLRMNAAVRAGMEAAGAAMTPGASPADVQRAIEAAVDAHGARCSYWSGHGIGQDVIEEPWLGLEVVQDRDEPARPWPLEPSMVLSAHPYVLDQQGRGMGYMADTYVTGASGGTAFSTIPLDLHVAG